MRRFLVLALLFGLALAQVPAAWLGLEVREQQGALVFQKGALSFSYVPGIGWTAPLDPALPPPRGDELRLDERVVRAAGLIPPELPSARLRYRLAGDRLRLVLDLPPGPAPELPRAAGESPGWFVFYVPYFVPNPPASR